MTFRWLSFVVAILAGCSGVPEELDWPADTPGQYAVGFTRRTLTYTTESNEQRTLPIAIWYPAATRQGPPVSYLEAFERPNVHQGAPAVDHAIATVVWSHGNLAFAEASGFLGEHLASHGIVTLAPEHTGNTIRDIGEGVSSATYLTRPQDLSAAFDWWLTRGEGDPLAPLVNDRAVVGGHSFGGYTAIALTGGRYHRSPDECDPPFSNWCTDLSPERLARFSEGFADDRFEASLLYNSGSGSSIRADTVDVPTLMFTAGRDDRTPNNENGDLFWMDLKRPGNVRIDDPLSSHSTLTVVCEIAPGLEPDGGCGDDLTPWTTAWDWSNAYSLAFIRWVLWEHDASRELIEGPALMSGLSVESR